MRIDIDGVGRRWVEVRKGKKGREDPCGGRGLFCLAFVDFPAATSLTALVSWLVGHSQAKTNRYRASNPCQSSFGPDSSLSVRLSSERTFIDRIFSVTQPTQDPPSLRNIRGIYLCLTCRDIGFRHFQRLVLLYRHRSWSHEARFEPTYIPQVTLVVSGRTQGDSSVDKFAGIRPQSDIPRRGVTAGKIARLLSLHIDQPSQ